MYCTKCGRKLNEDDLFCPGCGNRVNREEKPAAEKEVGKQDLSGAEVDNADVQDKDEEGDGQENVSDQKTEEETSDAGETVSELGKNAADMASAASQFAAEMASKAGQSAKKAAADLSHDMKDAKTRFESDTKNADQSGEKQESHGFSKFWNSPALNKAAEKFGNILTVVEGVVFLILTMLLFSEGGFWGIAFGLLFLLAGAACVIGGIKDLLSHTKKELTEKELNKAKRNMCIGVPVIIIALWILLSTGGGVYSNVQAITFDSYGSETIGEIVDNNLKSPKWSKDKIDSTSCKVYVKGYSKLYGEDVRITFYYEEDGGSYEVTLQSVELLDSGETYSDMFSLALIWAAFY